MIEFHDYDIKHPFEVVGEKHIVTDNKITLNYAPLKGSVSIGGFSEDTTGTLAAAAFYIAYDEENDYRSADQIVRFSSEAEGTEVKVNYQGVSTLLRAKHMNEIKDYMERGAPTMVANMLIAHESALVGYFESRINGLVEAINEVNKSVADVAAALGGLGGGTFVDDSLVSSDEEADEMLDVYFPTEGGVETVESSDFDESQVATDEEAKELLDSIFPVDD